MFTAVRLILFCGLFLLSSGAMAAEWIKASVSSEGGPLYREPNRSSPILGQYPSGTQLKVYSEPRAGFYAIYFSKPWNGVQYVWIPADRINPETTSSQDKRKRSSFSEDDAISPEYFKYSLTLTGSLALLNPSDLQTTIGTQFGTLLSPGFDLAFDLRFSKRLGASLRASYYAFSQPVSGNSGISLNYSGNGFSGILSLFYYLITSTTFSLRLEAGGGASTNSLSDSFTNNSTAYQVSNNSVTGFPIAASLDGSYIFSKHFYFLLRAGYQIHTLATVYVVVPPAAAPLSATSVTLSSPFASAGVGFQF
jgi:hypothetical protein